MDKGERLIAEETLEHLFVGAIVDGMRTISRDNKDLFYSL